MAYVTNVRIIPNGIDPVHMRSVLPSTEYLRYHFRGTPDQRESMWMFWCGRLHLLLHRISPDCTLLVLGDGPEREHISALIKDLAIEDRVLLKPFTDSHDEVISLMKSSHVCVIPSTREGFGIAALEALACGLPVVTVDHPDNAICELITKEPGSALLCPWGTPFRW